MTETPQPYNPLDRVELGRSVERALLAQPLLPLEDRKRKFAGAGLYAIYYDGPFPLYDAITSPRRARGEIPVYVGRARPPGARQGLVAGLSGSTSEPALQQRLREHVNSIKNVERHAALAGSDNLRVEDFYCRYLVADDIWVPLGEALLIGHYRPVWNVVLDGFGNHAAGGGRRDQARSAWDELHPGRSWASRLPPPRASAEELVNRVRAHLLTVAAPDLDAIPVFDQVVVDALGAEEAGRSDHRE